MKYCFNCGFCLEDDASFCNSCGANQEYDKNFKQEVLEARKHMSGYFWNITHCNKLDKRAQRKVCIQTFIGGLVIMLILIFIYVLVTVFMI